MSEKERVGITPKSWTGRRHHGVLHLGNDGMCSAPTSMTQAPRKVCVLTGHMRITKRLRPRWSDITRSPFHQRTDSRAPELEQCPAA